MALNPNLPPDPGLTLSPATIAALAAAISGGSGGGLPTGAAGAAGTTAGYVQGIAGGVPAPVSVATLPLPANAAQDGTDATGVTAPSGAAGIRGWLSGIYSKLTGTLAVSIAAALNVNPFTPIAAETIALTVGPTSTTAPVALPAVTATVYRIRNPITSASPVAYRLATSATAAVLPVAYSTAGTGGTVGDKMIDPGVVEVIGLTATQQTALAAGTLFLSAITPASGSAVLYITPGTAGL